LYSGRGRPPGAGRRKRWKAAQQVGLNLKIYIISVEKRPHNLHHQSKMSCWDTETDKKGIHTRTSWKETGELRLRRRGKEGGRVIRGAAKDRRSTQTQSCVGTERAREKTATWKETPLDYQKALKKKQKERRSDMVVEEKVVINKKSFDQNFV